MMIERGISTKELFQVSAYIDGALSPKEQRNFEAHLASSATLQRELLEYKRLKAALWSLPHKKAPRNFTLSPEKVQVRKAVPRFAPAFSFASAGVAILLMLAFGSEWLLHRYLPCLNQQLQQMPPNPRSSSGMPCLWARVEVVLRGKAVTVVVQCRVLLKMCQ
jgi:hypothetical protein